MPASFDKDFGYLMPFLDRVAEAARALPDAGARAEATQLVAGERERFARLQALLGGAAGKQAAERPAPAASPASRAQSHAGGVAANAPLAGAPQSFTVGALKSLR